MIKKRIFIGAILPLLMSYTVFADESYGVISDGDVENHKIEIDGDEYQYSDVTQFKDLRGNTVYDQDIMSFLSKEPPVKYTVKQFLNGDIELTKVKFVSWEEFYLNN